MQPGSSPVSVRLPFEPGGHTRKAIGEKVGTRVEPARTYVLDAARGGFVPEPPIARHTVHPVAGGGVAMAGGQEG